MLTATGIDLHLPSGSRLDLQDMLPQDFTEAARLVYGLDTGGLQRVG